MEGRGILTETGKRNRNIRKQHLFPNISETRSRNTEGKPIAEIISNSGCQQNMFYSIFSQIRTDFEPVQGPCTMNVGNEPLHDKACVVKCKIPPEWRWKLCKFQHGKRILVLE